MAEAFDSGNTAHSGEKSAEPGAPQGAGIPRLFSCVGRHIDGKIDFCAAAKVPLA
ncbi:MAG: hypothetical protein LUD69_08205 [Oscillospiraceae bacterium]|nr:hypothetical protein [Oscillospiraceae bacterium]